MWFVAHQMAPIGYQVSLSRAVCTIILMGVCNFVTKVFLAPVIGNWYVVAYFLACTLLAMTLLRLKFWRSVLVVLIYLAVWTVGYVALGFNSNSHQAHQSTGQTRPSTSNL